MTKPALLLFCLVLILSSCVNQSPAPIEYGSGSTATKPGADTSSSDMIVTKSQKNDGAENSENDKWTKSEENRMPVDEDAAARADEPKKEEPVIAIRTADINHEVIEGETLESIAAQYGVTKEAIIAKNKLNPPYQLEELQILVIPPQATNSPEANIGDVVTPAPIETSTVPIQQEEIAAAPPSNTASAKMPVKGEIIVKFGEVYHGSPNQGVNISSPLGTNIESVVSGRVVHSAHDAKFGNLVIIKSENSDIFTAYAHMNDLIVKSGTQVTAGDVIGHVGQSGTVTKPQLHFAVRSGNVPVDPVEYLSNTKTHF